jgi:hypothetical protein
MTADAFFTQQEAKESRNRSGGLRIDAAGGV